MAAQNPQDLGVDYLDQIMLTTHLHPTVMTTPVHQGTSEAGCSVSFIWHLQVIRS